MNQKVAPASRADWVLTLGVLLAYFSSKILYLKENTKPSSTYICFALTGIFGSMTHFYDVFESIALLLILWILLPKRRMDLAIIAAIILVSSFLYLKIVIQPNTRFSLNTGWVSNNIDYYKVSVWGALQSSFSGPSIAILSIVILSIIGVNIFARAGEGLGLVKALPSLNNESSFILMSAGVVFLVFIFGVVTSQLFTPNFTVRNWLVVSPFIWIIVAGGYDIGVGKLPSVPRFAIAVVLALLATYAQRIVLARGLPTTEPYKQASEMVRSFPSCRGEQIPSLNLLNASLKDTVFAREWLGFGMQYYLGDFAHPLILFDDAIETGLPSGVEEMYVARLSGAGCPVLAVLLHSYMEPARLVGQLRSLASRHALSPHIAIRELRVYVPGSRTNTMSGGYVVYRD